MFHRRTHLTAGLVVAALLLSCGSAWLFAQAAPREFFIVCIGQAPPAAPGTAATFYFSGVLQGPATALLAFRTAFAQYLAQRYAFKGVPACSPGNTEAIAQNFVTQRSTALRNAKFNVVDTGWIETAEAAAAAAAAPARGAATPATANAGTTGNRGSGGRAGAPTATSPENATAGNNARGQSGASGNASSGNSNSPEAEIASILSSLFGNKAAGNTGGSASGTGGASTGGSGTAGRQGQNTARGGSGTSGATNNQTPATQISSTLTTVFNNKSTTAANGGRGSQLPNGALGSAEFGTTKLVVYGCGRQDVQVACVTELTNQNAKDSLVLSANVWKDAFLVDDRGDRHLRTNGFFLNIDGEQRQQLDISVGKTAKFILMFDNIQTRVQKVTLRSQTGGLDVEDIGLLSADAGQGAAAATPASPQR
jgi:hypothetical protein